MYRVRTRGKVTGRLITLQSTPRTSIKMIVQAILNCDCFYDTVVEKVVKCGRKNIFYKIPLTRYINKKSIGGETFEELYLRV